jgi:hypothetical protein
MIDQIGGWTSGKISEGNGEGYSKNDVNKFMLKTK